MENTKELNMIRIIRNLWAWLCDFKIGLYFSKFLDSMIVPYHPRVSCEERN